MINRRDVLLSAMGLILLPADVLAKSAGQSFDWKSFYTEMKKLANASQRGRVDQREMARQGLSYLKQLDVDSSSFREAVESSYETGNQFWLWQRMVKENNLNGGILNIDRDNFVQLHDHPNATGMLKIISGEVEVWQFDRIAGNQSDAVSELKQTSRRVLRPGDLAVLHPDHGNIHALRSISKECRMLDFFIPPYTRSERSWYEPYEKNWFDHKHISCRKISQHEYDMA